MQAYETSATVQALGEVHVAGVPFAPGTEVEVTIREKAVDQRQAPANSEEAHTRMKDLFARARTKYRAGWAAAPRGTV